MKNILSSYLPPKLFGIRDQSLASSGILLSLIFFLTACSDPQLELKQYSDKEGRFTIKIPSGWEIDSSNQRAALIVRNTQKPSSAFKESIVLMVLNVPDSMTTEENFQANIKDVSALPSFMILKNEGVNINGYDGYILAYSAAINGQQLVSLSLYLYKDDKLFLLQCMTDKEGLKQYGPLYNEIAASVKLL